MRGVVWWWGAWCVHTYMKIINQSIDQSIIIRTNIQTLFLSAETSGSCSSTPVLACHVHPPPGLRPHFDPAAEVIHGIHT